MISVEEKIPGKFRFRIPIKIYSSDWIVNNFDRWNKLFCESIYIIHRRNWKRMCVTKQTHIKKDTETETERYNISTVQTKHEKKHIKAKPHHSERIHRMIHEQSIKCYICHLLAFCYLFFLLFILEEKIYRIVYRREMFKYSKLR